MKIYYPYLYFSNSFPVTNWSTSSPFRTISLIFVPEISIVGTIQSVLILCRSQIPRTHSFPVKRVTSSENNFFKFAHHRSSSCTSSSQRISIFSCSSRGMLARMISSRSCRVHGFSSVPDFSADPMMMRSLS